MMMKMIMEQVSSHDYEGGYLIHDDDDDDDDDDIMVVVVLDEKAEEEEEEEDEDAVLRPPGHYEACIQGCQGAGLIIFNLFACEAWHIAEVSDESKCSSSSSSSSSSRRTAFRRP